MTSGDPSLSRRQLLGTAALASSLVCGGSAVLPVTRPDPRRFDACRGQRRLRLLTWNVFLMPEWLHESPWNLARAAGIARALLKQDFDILCLQKCFDRAAREVIEQALAVRYPHRYGPANGGGLLLNSGVWVLSQSPLTDYQEIAFSDCASWECFSRKGALLLSGSCGETPFRLIVTHLQGENSTAFTPEHQALRDLQLLQIRDELIAPHLETNVPMLLAGDFGTPRLENAGGGESASYRKLLATLGVEDGPEAQVTLDELHNELAASDSRRQNQVDYIFIRSNGARLGVTRARHVFREPAANSETEPRDLSYHYAVSAELSFGQ